MTPDLRSKIRFRERLKRDHLVDYYVIALVPAWEAAVLCQCPVTLGQLMLLEQIVPWHPNVSAPANKYKQPFAGRERGRGWAWDEAGGEAENSRKQT